MAVELSYGYKILRVVRFSICHRHVEKVQTASKGSCINETEQMSGARTRVRLILLKYCVIIKKSSVRIGMVCPEYLVA
jgi:hypothetical protein